MSYASKAGRARTNPTSPVSQAVCDRCGIWYSMTDLHWQFDWRGVALQNLRILVCDHCLDTPQQQLRAIIVPADPTPTINARVEPFLADESTYVTGPYGTPVGLDQAAIMPLNNGVRYGVQIPLISVLANGTQTIAVSCGAPHGLATNGQISVDGLTAAGANGFYSVTVTTATAFTYQTFANVAAGGLLTPTTRMVTCLVGLPLGVTIIPQVG